MFLFRNIINRLKVRDRKGGSGDQIVVKPQKLAQHTGYQDTVLVFNDAVGQERNAFGQSFVHGVK